MGNYNAVHVHVAAQRTCTEMKGVRANGKFILKKSNKKLKN